MSKQSKKLIKMAYISMIAALYVVLTFVSAIFGMAYSGVQLRLSEMLTILPVFTPLAVPGLTIGCFIANLASPFGFIDVIFGTFSTLIVAFLTRLLRKIRIKNIPILAPLPPVLLGSASVSLIILSVSSEVFNLGMFIFLSLSIGIGQFIVCYLFGIPLFIVLNKLKLFDNLEKITKGVKKIE